MYLWVKTFHLVFVIAWMATGPGQGCRGSRVAPVEINGTVGFAQWKPSGPNGEFEAWGITALRIEDGVVTGLSIFLNTELFSTVAEGQVLADRLPTQGPSTLRPHSALQGRTPLVAAQAAAA